MKSYQFNDFHIMLDKQGSGDYSKASYPIRYGRFVEITTPDHVFQLNLNGEIKYIQGRGKSWPHPAEWLKRTSANDWVYYSTCGYTGVYDFFGEYYLPCLSYPSNSVIGGDPFDDDAIGAAINSWYELLSSINASISEPASQGLRRFLDLMSRNHAMALVLKSRKLHDLVGSQLTVLPPDTRHVDYEVIPLVVADGCLYNCRFCRVKSGLGFAPRTKENIMCQIERLKKLYALDVRNYNSVFLGEHDALCAGRDLLEFAAKNAYEIFDFKHSHLRGANLFFFGSVNSLLSCDDTTFELLNGLPFNTHINIGLESADQTTLDLLNKPITVDMIQDAFVKMLDTNRRYENIEVTANFVFGDELPQSHLPAFFELTADNIDRFYGKGAIYFSPLANGRPKGKRSLLRQFYKVKAKSRLPTFLYLIQRL